MKKKYIDDLDIMNAKDTVRIYKHCNGNCDQCPRRTPHGVRGLKFVGRILSDVVALRSHPAWGAWIEISILGHFS